MDFRSKAEGVTTFIKGGGEAYILYSRAMSVVARKTTEKRRMMILKNKR